MNANRASAICVKLEGECIVYVASARVVDREDVEVSAVKPIAVLDLAQSPHASIWVPAWPDAVVQLVDLELGCILTHETKKLLHPRLPSGAIQHLDLTEPVAFPSLVNRLPLHLHHDFHAPREKK
eukprot:CAMPEP_0119374372 /NCGR_PEP_ID=MMETSP1334-20130426/30558_1 /TAXON_ID=127549 /ORGANISM="Calcidiscus leptoporus, Strain RCC1130" /LENGTH=124 /DNA_ID=CAMNT_0007392421 /DNA_START=193 /DNA_END=567 /DNA_ORIENTATION=+